jgi:hypothetical protein
MLFSFCLSGAMNGENDYGTSLPEFDPIKHHNNCCPWVNGYVAAACSMNSSSITNSSAFCGWQLTLDALETVQSLGQDQTQAMQSDSAASLYKVGIKSKVCGFHLFCTICFFLETNLISARKNSMKQ